MKDSHKRLGHHSLFRTANYFGIVLIFGKSKFTYDFLSGEVFNLISLSLDEVDNWFRFGAGLQQGGLVTELNIEHSTYEANSIW